MLRLYRGGFTAVETLGRWSRAKGIEDHPAVRSLSVMAAAFDKMMLSRDFVKMLNSEAIELLSRRMWGTMRAFDAVNSVGDWRKPTGAGANWKCKVNWAVLEEMDALNADKDNIKIPELEDELRKRFKDKALMEKSLPAGASGDDPGF